MSYYVILFILPIILAGILAYLSRGNIKPTVSKIIISLVLALPVMSIILGIEQAIFLGRFFMLLYPSSYFYFIYVFFVSPVSGLIIFLLGFLLAYSFLSFTKTKSLKTNNV